MATLELNDGTLLHYEDTGGDGPALLLMHSVFTHSAMWQPYTEALSPDYRVITVDARAHGETVDTGVDFTMWDLSLDAWTLLDSLGIETVALGGVCLGSYTALRMAIHAPDRVRGMALMSVMATGQPADRRTVIENFADSWLASGGTVYEAFCRLLASATIGGSVERHQVWFDYWMAIDKARLRATAKSMLPHESIAGMLTADVHCPTILLRGEHDMAVTREDMERLGDVLSGSSGVHTVAGASQWANVSHAPEVLEVLRDFLKTLP